ncbi:MAG: Anti-sigma factor [Rhodobacteraceae bacterium HLUCCA09]|nr:MAG: Anti-sigma factor [Rhodobacteraceae bacterium HLUCCA09]
MRINAEFDRPARVRFADGEWVGSPSAGVERRMLDRLGGEVARATSLVRFAPGSAFDPHTHDGGEEYLVLEGTFQDEEGDFPVGAYVRNPPGTSHRPAAAEGAVILVKLHQFDPADRTAVHARLDSARAAPVAGQPGVSAQVLHRDAREAVRLEVWAPGAEVTRELPGGAELFVLAGGYTEGGMAMGPWDWLRLPAGGRLESVAGPEGARLWVKEGHLAAPIGLDQG